MKRRQVVIMMVVLWMVTIMESPSWAKNRNIRPGGDDNLVIPSILPDSSSVESDIKKKQVLEQNSGIAAASAQKGRTGTKRRTPAKPTQSAANQPKNVQISSDEGVDLSSVTVKALTDKETKVEIGNKSALDKSLKEPMLRTSETVLQGPTGKEIVDSRTFYEVGKDGGIQSINQKRVLSLFLGNGQPQTMLDTNLAFRGKTIEFLQREMIFDKEGKPVLSPYSEEVAGDFNAESFSKQGIEEGANSSSFKMSIDGKLKDGTEITTVFAETHGESPFLVGVDAQGNKKYEWRKSIVAFTFLKEGDGNSLPILVHIFSNDETTKELIRVVAGVSDAGSGSQVEGVLLNFLTKKGKLFIQAEATLLPKK